VLNRTILLGRLVLVVGTPVLLIACVEGEAPSQFDCSDDDCESNGFSDTHERGTDFYGDQSDCPDDPAKDNPGICGCGVPDEDKDGDGYMDCVDDCADDADKLKPGICGCGVPDINSDGDGLVDCMEECPQDPHKYEAGNCGCGKDEAGWLLDADRDGVPDCLDDCKNDPQKDSPGDCGCGVADIDTDRDGTADCADLCQNDPTKTEPGICGCGTSDTDSDGDDVADCNDSCPLDSNKIEAGVCGCGNTEEECIGRVTLQVDDAMVNESESKTNFNGSKMSIDLVNNPGTTYVLLKPLDFSVIPYGSTVMTAELTVTIFDGGDKISIRNLLEPFEESQVTYKNRPDHGMERATMSGKKGTQSANVISVVQDWVDGDPAYGLALYPTGENGADIYSSEYNVVGERPKLTIVYRKPNY